MKVFDALLHFISVDEELNEDKEIKNWNCTSVKVDANDYVYMYDIETIEGESMEITVHAIKQ